VAFFLDQCLDSVLKSIKGISAEIIVVDNASRDNSVALVKKNYPTVKLIENAENCGFSKANNQAIRVANGKWILLLNPDTVVAEDTLQECLKYVSDKPDCGALGIRMINGTGAFLPESKRGLPTPLVAFYKLSGLSSVFKNSKRFNRYHAGHIKEDQSAPTDVLSGAFMFIRKEALDKVGLLDESFFMYGEDIDLSYRITLGGYTNHYFADSTIIHYKGESTKKSSVNYVFVFYRAMVIFAKKHFGKKHAGLFSFIINSGIYFRAFMALMSRIVKRFLAPSMDVLLIASGMFALSNYWKSKGIEFPENAFNVLIPSYSFIWVLSGIFNGSYDQPSVLKAFRSSIFGTLVILVAYALLPKEWQFSRLFIIVGTLWVFAYMILSRWYFGLFSGNKMILAKRNLIRFLIIGNEESTKAVKSLLENSQVGIATIQTTRELNEDIKLREFDELIFCADSVSYKTCIKEIARLRNQNLEFKIAPEGRNYLIGSNSIETAGDLYVLEVNKLVSDENKRKKRLLDSTFSLFFLLISVFLIFFFERKTQFVKNMWNVLIGRSTFIGFTDEDILKDHRLPKTKKGILSPCDEFPFTTEDLCEKIKLLYARDYSIRKDLRIILTSFKKLDRK
jgi:GT2 family glycosyltransferase